MAQIATTTTLTPLNYPAYQPIDVDPGGGWLWTTLRDASGNLLAYRSQDGGSTWTLLATLTRANVQEYSGIYVDSFYWLFVAYRTYESGADRIYIRSLSLGTMTWGPELLVGAAVAGSAGAYHSGVAIKATFYNDAYYVLVATGVNVGGGRGVTLLAATMDSAGVSTVNNGLISGTREWVVPGSGTGRVGPAVDFEHNGDNKTAWQPNAWVVFGRGELSVVKLSWSGGQWTGPTSYTTLVSGLPAQDAIPGRWVGDRYMTAAPYVSDTTRVRVFERNWSNSATNTRTTPVHPAGVVRNCSFAYDSSTGDIRVYAVGTSSTILYYVDYVRASGTFTAWAQVTATPLLGVTQWGVRNSNFGNAKFDVVVTADATPDTVTHIGQLIPYNPNTPTWDEAGSTVGNGAAANVAATLLLNWNFSDPDPADTQGWYALSRQIGAGTINYWRASDSTWQTTEQQNSSSTTSVTLPASWGAGSDATHTYKVKTWDITNRASGYSAGFVVVPSVLVNPTITAPTAAQVLNTNTVTVTWTVSEQTARRVVLKTSPGGVVTHDSGMQTTSSLSYTVPVSLADGTAWTVELTTRNNEGLTSATQTRAFTVDFVEPPAPTTVATAVPASGVITVAITNPAASGSQPALASQELWRRKAISAVLNANPYFETNATGWSGLNGSVARSTAQAHQGAASLLLTPSGSGAVASALLTAGLPVDLTKAYTAAGWCRLTTANKPARLMLHWYTAGDVFISTTFTEATAVAGVWLYLSVTDAPPPTTGFVRVAAGQASTPAVGDTAYWDELTLAVGNADVGVRVAAGLPSGAVVGDWGAASGVAYEYRSKVSAANGTFVYGPWAA